MVGVTYIRIVAIRCCRDCCYIHTYRGVQFFRGWCYVHTYCGDQDLPCGNLTACTVCELVFHSPCLPPPPPLLLLPLLLLFLLLLVVVTGALLLSYPSSSFFFSLLLLVLCFFLIPPPLSSSCFCFLNLSCMQGHPKPGGIVSVIFFSSVLSSSFLFFPVQRPLFIGPFCLFFGH